MFKDNTKGPKRGVSAYSYSGELGVTMTLEDVFEEMRDLGAHGIEILANASIPNYPNPTDEWVEHWFALCDKYEVVPAEYGHWVDSALFKGRTLSTEESLRMLERDIKLASRLGFHVLRTKLGVTDWLLTPVENWKEFISAALPIAKKYDVCMCPEIHLPTALSSDMVKNFVEFIQEHETENFGLNIDFGAFQNKFDGKMMMPGLPEDGSPQSVPEELIPLIPYIHCCHAKFNHMDENFEETTIPYEEILTILRDNGYDGYMVSEYEGPHKDEPGYVSEQIRRQHVMMKRILGY